MSAQDEGRTSTHETLAALRREVAELTARVASIEARLTGAAGEARRSGAVTPEILAAMTAALAAHLGVRPRIRQVSLVGGAAWAQQGRVTIQASHALAVQRD
jgi:methylmalonyl-CoA carboxyltransferase large subunit